MSVEQSSQSEKIGESERRQRGRGNESVTEMRGVSIGGEERRGETNPVLGGIETNRVTVCLADQPGMSEAFPANHRCLCVKQRQKEK